MKFGSSALLDQIWQLTLLNVFSRYLVIIVVSTILLFNQYSTSTHHLILVAQLVQVRRCQLQVLQQPQHVEGACFPIHRLKIRRLTWVDLSDDLSDIHNFLIVHYNLQYSSMFFSIDEFVTNNLLLFLPFLKFYKSITYILCNLWWLFCDNIRPFSFGLMFHVLNISFKLEFHLSLELCTTVKAFSVNHEPFVFI